MRRLARLLPIALCASLLGLAPAGSSTSPLVHVPLGEDALISDNVTYLGTIPIEAIGGRMLQVGDQTRFYVTGVPGLVIYDVTDPALPVPLGGLPLPHFQNEDVDVSDDGSRVIIATDTVHVGSNPAGTVSAGTGSIRVIDTSDPANPRVTGLISQGNHTATCADPACDWIYGSTGRIYRVDEDGQIHDNNNNWRQGGGGHALNRDESGLVISDSTPRHVLDVTGAFVEGASPASPATIATGRPNAQQFGPDGLLQHNNVRPSALEWEPRNPDDPDFNDPALRPGELLLGNSESNIRPACGSNAGGLSAWSMVNFDRGQDLQQIQVFRPVNGTWTDGNPAINALGCSGHWFTVRDYMVAAAWYEHGLRFVSVDPETGEFQQRGFFNPAATEMGSAHWVADADGNEYVYTTDYARGIDIVRFDRSAAAPSQAEITASWLANLGAVGQAASAERLVCRLGAQAGD